MKTFLKWAESNRLPLPDVSEATKRSGIAHWAYPDAYVRQQYPDGYFTPYAADAIFKMGNKKVDRRAAPANTPG